MASLLNNIRQYYCKCIVVKNAAQTASQRHNGFINDDIRNGGNGCSAHLTHNECSKSMHTFKGSSLVHMIIPFPETLLVIHLRIGKSVIELVGANYSKLPQEQHNIKMKFSNNIIIRWTLSDCQACFFPLCSESALYCSSSSSSSSWSIIHLSAFYTEQYSDGLDPVLLL